MIGPFLSLFPDYFASHGQAALVGSKVDVVLPKHKRPKSKYAASVIREINLRKHLHGDEVTIELLWNYSCQPKKSINIYL